MLDRDVAELYGVEAFAKLRELTEVICKLPEVLDESAQEALMVRGEIE